MLNISKENIPVPEILIGTCYTNTTKLCVLKHLGCMQGIIRISGTKIHVNT